ncbi:DUF1858 domain-containing protein [Sulfurovum sp. NBC37-1]|uniref:DUF1858 domain-containing protein n=1 Tax=Sulfurovum sp. (strain NBC37-1) TaxID=387093 RepID=UPI0001587C70|nr:DUF1858 domain-containing protein [Sulfurovum sp. NBC37-1]BAF72264.1 conserved hypothetical protein [Sulfurovum sp. NBC37-1]
MKEITLATTIADLLKNYEGMKDILIGINPKFKKLNNPVLRRTIAKLATVKQAAIVGGMDANDLLNQLRTAVGQEPLQTERSETDTKEYEPLPDWTKGAPKATLNANEILDNEGNPLAEANKTVRPLASGEILEIVSDFRPEPLIDEFTQKGHEVAVKEEKEDRFITLIRKA